MIRRRLYGSRDGSWLVLEGPVGPSFPIMIEDLVLLGKPADIIARVYLEGKNQRNQTELGIVLGISQQTLSRYLSGRREPHLPANGWRKLVRLHFIHHEAN